MSKVDVGDFPPKVRQKYQKREAKEQATRAKNDAKISQTDDPTKRSKLIANEETRREKVDIKFQNTEYIAEKDEYNEEIIKSLQKNIENSIQLRSSFLVETLPIKRRN